MFSGYCNHRETGCGSPLMHVTLDCCRGAHYDARWSFCAERARQICGLTKDRESRKRELLELMRAEFVIRCGPRAVIGRQFCSSCRNAHGLYGVECRGLLWCALWCADRPCMHARSSSFPIWHRSIAARTLTRCRSRWTSRRCWTPTSLRTGSRPNACSSTKTPQRRALPPASLRQQPLHHRRRS